MVIRDLAGVVVLATLTLWFVVELRAEPQVQNGNIRVGSFNVQVFGLTKFKKDEVILILCEVSFRDP